MTDHRIRYFRSSDRIILDTHLSTRAAILDQGGYKRL